jgi:DnaJ-class molecular chaperone
MWDCPTCKGTGQVDDTKKPASENDEQTIQTVTNYEVGYKQGVADAMKLFDEEMSETGDVRNARQAMKTLLRFGPQRAA